MMNTRHVPADTRKALARLPEKDCSRSLYFDRFANPQLKKGARQDHFEKALAAHRSTVRMESWTSWLLGGGLGIKPEEILHAKLQSRLMVNMAGGVMENAGLCLDRFGIPFLPGSAVKGCARRAAIQSLLEKREGGGSPAELVALLSDIGLVFGWGEQEWKASTDKHGRFKSDFVYPIGPDLWQQVAAAARLQLPNTDHFGGVVGFLPAFPHRLPTTDIELDVVTCHHPEYYRKALAIATDKEEPIPVVFPAVKAGIVFQFAVLPLRGERQSHSRPDTKLHILAHDWLGDGLATFGLGAKTAAGYGWFKLVVPPGVGIPTVPARTATAGCPAATIPLEIKAADRLIVEWRGKTQPPNFRGFRPSLAKIVDTEELRRVFNAIMPPTEIGRFKKSNPYWQSFAADADGKAILHRLGIILK